MAEEGRYKEQKSLRKGERVDMEEEAWEQQEEIQDSITNQKVRQQSRKGEARGLIYGLKPRQNRP